MRPFPIGIDDFRKLRENDYYYADKTMFIKELLDNRGEVSLFTRPRRFGKTLGISMLKYFFEDECGARENRYLFEGLEIMEARITYLAYAPEIAAVMLQRQQASAVVDARTMIVDGAVGMVKMALEKLDEDGIVELDEERKAAMVSNLSVVLCGNHDAQPIVNSGSLY